MYIYIVAGLQRALRDCMPVITRPLLLSRMFCSDATWAAVVLQEKDEERRRTIEKTKQGEQEKERKCKIRAEVPCFNYHNLPQCVTIDYTPVHNYATSIFCSDATELLPYFRCWMRNDGATLRRRGGRSIDWWSSDASIRNRQRRRRRDTSVEIGSCD